MPNLIELIDKSNIIKQKLSDIISNIKSDILSGIIKNKTEAFIRLRDDSNLMITSLIRPTMCIREISKYPVSEDFNDMFNEAWVDIRNIFESTNLTSKVLDASFNKITVERNMLTSISKNVNKRIQEIENDINEMFSTNKYKNFVESFTNYDYYDSNMVSLTPATIDTMSGSLSLGRTYLYEYDKPLVEVTNNSTGFPGDTHQISVAGGNIVFNGELEAHASLQNMVDDNKDSWFEYEAIKVDQLDYDKTGGYGFDYKEGISWLTELNELVLEVNSAFTVAHLLNMLYIDPFIPIESTFIPSKISSIIIDDGKGLVKELLTSPIEFKREIIVFFDIQYVRYITIKFVQNNSYKTLIGHNYFVELKSSKNILEPIGIDGDRTDGPKKSVELLGIRYEPSTGIYNQPYMAIPYIEPKINELYTTSAFNSNKIEEIESLNASRYQIGIREINASCVEFTNQSEYVSNAFNFDTPVNRIKIISDDQCPSTFPGEKSQWIKYSISIDNGSTWIDIESDNEITISETNTIRVNIKLERPTSISRSKYQSPIIYEYCLKGRYEE